MIKSIVVDGHGRGDKAGVEDGALCVSDRGVPPQQLNGEVRIFRQFLTADGTDSGSNDMRVNGTSTAAVPFYVGSASDADRYVCTLSFLIADANANLNQFGNITALSNGCNLFYEDGDLGNVTIHSALTSNFDFVRLCNGNPSFGNTTNVFKASNASGNSDGYLPVLNIKEVFGLTWGIKLTKGSTKRIVLEVKDDATGVDAFNCIAYGFDRLR